MRLLGLTLLVACSSPASWKPPALAETTRRQGDLIIRYEPDDTISVTTRVAVGNVSASGLVLLRRSSLETAAQSVHVRLARARAWQTLAVILGDDPGSSFDAAKRGLAELASIESSEAVARAERAYASNNETEAAREMSGALREQLRSYVTKFHHDVW